MSQNKKAYFQGGGGVNEPTPKKKKYKSDPAIVVQPRFEEPLYRNYDLYETEGVNGPAKHGPGVGWHDMHKYKSIADFLKDKRKKLKDKYKADDSWVEDNGSITKKDPSKIKVRARIFSKLIKNAIEFPLDDYTDPTLGDSESDNLVGKSNPLGGYLDKYLPKNDFEGKMPTDLTFGHKDPNESDDYSGCSDEDIAYTDARDAYYCKRCGHLGHNGPTKPKPTAKELHSGKDYTLDDNNLDKLEQKYLNPTESPLLGLPDGVDSEAKDAVQTINDINPEYGTTDSGNQTYKNLVY